MNTKLNATDKRETNICPLHVASESVAGSNKPENYAPLNQTGTKMIWSISS